MAQKRLVVTVGDRLRSAREKKKLSQLEVANAAGVRPEVISRLERNRTGASLASLYKLAPVLDLSLDELVKDQQAEAVRKATIRKTTPQTPPPATTKKTKGK